MDELYDLQSDPGEMKNQIAESSARSTADAMRKDLDRYRQQIQS
jgi:hypothetical protein